MIGNERLTQYRYGGIRSKHPTLAARAALEAARRVSSIQHPDDGEDMQEDGEEEERRPNFAQRLLLGQSLSIIVPIELC